MPRAAGVPVTVSVGGYSAGATAPRHPSLAVLAIGLGLKSRAPCTHVCTNKYFASKLIITLTVTHRCENASKRYKQSQNVGLIPSSEFSPFSFRVGGGAFWFWFLRGKCESVSSQKANDARRAAVPSLTRGKHRRHVPTGTKGRKAMFSPTDGARAFKRYYTCAGQTRKKRRKKHDDTFPLSHSCWRQKRSNEARLRHRAPTPSKSPT